MPTANPRALTGRPGQPELASSPALAHCSMYRGWGATAALLGFLLLKAGPAAAAGAAQRGAGQHILIKAGTAQGACRTTSLVLPAGGLRRRVGAVAAPAGHVRTRTCWLLLLLAGWRGGQP